MQIIMPNHINQSLFILKEYIMHSATHFYNINSNFISLYIIYKYIYNLYLSVSQKKILLCQTTFTTLKNKGRILDFKLIIIQDDKDKTRVI